MTTLEDLLFAKSDASTLLTIVLIHATGWFFFIPLVAKNLIKPWFDKQKFRDQWLDFNIQSAKTLGIDIPDKEAAYITLLEIFPILFQHGIGGSLCLPSILNWSWVSPEAKTALAVHGALCEVGWELQDLIYRYYKYNYGTTEQKASQPPAVLFFITLHHCLGLSMVLPMTMIARDSKLFHEGVLLLEGAAFVSLLLQQYGYCLDVKSAQGALQMALIVTVNFTCIMYTRLVRFCPLALEILYEIIKLESYAIFLVALMGASTMGYFNSFLVKDVSLKLKKFVIDPYVLNESSSKEEDDAKPNKMFENGPKGIPTNSTSSGLKKRKTVAA